MRYQLLDVWREDNDMLFLYLGVTKRKNIDQVCELLDANERTSQLAGACQVCNNVLIEIELYLSTVN